MENTVTPDTVETQSPNPNILKGRELRRAKETLYDYGVYDDGIEGVPVLPSLERTLAVRQMVEEQMKKNGDEKNLNKIGDKVAKKVRNDLLAFTPSGRITTEGDLGEGIQEELDDRRARFEALLMSDSEEFNSVVSQWQSFVNTQEAGSSASSEKAAKKKAIKTPRQVEKAELRNLKAKIAAGKRVLSEVSGDGFDALYADTKHYEELKAKYSQERPGFSKLKTKLGESALIATLKNIPASIREFRQNRSDRKTEKTSNKPARELVREEKAERRTLKREVASGRRDRGTLMNNGEAFENLMVKAGRLQELDEKYGRRLSIDASGISERANKLSNTIYFNVIGAASRTLDRVGDKVRSLKSRDYKELSDEERSERDKKFLSRVAVGAVAVLGAAALIGLKTVDARHGTNLAGNPKSNWLNEYFSQRSPNTIQSAASEQVDMSGWDGFQADQPDNYVEVEETSPNQLQENDYLNGSYQPELKEVNANEFFTGTLGTTEFSPEGLEDFHEWIDGTTVEQGDSIWKLSKEYLQDSGISAPTDYQIDAVKDQVLADFTKREIADSEGWLSAGDIIDIK